MRVTVRMESRLPKDREINNLFGLKLLEELRQEHHPEEVYAVRTGCWFINRPHPP